MKIELKYQVEEGEPIDKHGLDIIELNGEVDGIRKK